MTTPTPFQIFIHNCYIAKIVKKPLFLEICLARRLYARMLSRHSWNGRGLPIRCICSHPGFSVRIPDDSHILRYLLICVLLVYRIESDMCTFASDWCFVFHRSCLAFNIRAIVRVMVFNANFNNISVISLRLVLLVEKTTDKLYHIMLYWVHLAWAGFELTTLVVRSTDR